MAQETSIPLGTIYLTIRLWEGFVGVDSSSSGSLETMNPLHIHVYDAKGNFLGRLDLKTMTGVEGWIPSRKLRDLVQKLKSEGIL